MKWAGGFVGLCALAIPVWWIALFRSSAVRQLVMPPEAWPAFQAVLVPDLTARHSVCDCGRADGARAILLGALRRHVGCVGVRDGVHDRLGAKRRRAAVWALHS